MPIKIILRLIYNTVLGGIVLVVINVAGGLVGFNIAVNIASAFIAGALGIPGIILLVILKLVVV